MSLLTVLDSIGNLIGKIGTNPTFIAFNAHWGFAFALLAFFPSITLAIVILILAAVKEFWFDEKYEVDHPIWPVGIGDFLGYVCGIILGIAKMHWSL
jgi:hypothetical protein